MKKLGIVSVMALFVGILLGGSTAQAEGLKIGYVNLPKIFDEYHKTKEFDKQLSQEAEQKQSEREKLVNDVKKMRDEIELLSPDKRLEKQKAVDEKMAQLQAFDRDTRRNLGQKRDTMIREVLKEIDETVKVYGQAEKYDYILHDRALVYKNESYDISALIIKKLNEGN